MRPAWRLAINSLSGRRSRAALLSGAVALSAALVVTVACAMATVRTALNQHIEATIGRADLRLKPSGGGKTLKAAWLDRVRAWPEVEQADGFLQVSLALTLAVESLAHQPDGSWARSATRLKATVLATSLEKDGILAPPVLLAGRLPREPDEIVIDALAATHLSVREERAARKAWQPPALGLGSTAGAPWRKAGAAPQIPERVAGEPEARRINELIGLRLGDRVEGVELMFDAASIGFTLPFMAQTRPLKVVGISPPPPLVGRPLAYMTLQGLASIANEPGRLSQIDMIVRPGVDANEVVRSRRADVSAAGGEHLMIQTTAKITSGVSRNMQSSQLGFILATFMAFLSASFIILTGLTTSVMERQRELAILRCIGAERRQIATAQVLSGVLIGALGAVTGVPLGILIATLLAAAFRERLGVSGTIPPSAVVLAAAGAVVAGAAGAAWPAWRAARVSPLTALASRAEAPSRRGLVAVTLAGVACLIYQAAVVGLPRDGQVLFWTYVTSGLPLMFFGYFLLGVPAAMLVTRLLAEPLSRLLGLPRRLLARTVEGTPYRHGLTAGALMGGLALMVALWTNGGAFLRDWIGKIQFPDAFVSGLALSPTSQRTLDGMTDVVERTCAITLHPVETDAFGVRALQRYKTTFMAFEPEPFFAMMNPTWVQGHPAEAIPRLDRGGAVIVAREFLVAKGLGVGDTFRCRHNERDFEFEIVGVVTSPGLEIVSKFFNIGEDYTDQAMHAVFGSRTDLREKFGSDAIHLIQIDLKEGVDDAAALARFREALFGQILDAGSGKQVKEFIRTFAGGGLLLVTAVAVAAMLVACFGVANVIVAGIQARQFEFGVLRAVGAPRGMLPRLVIGEALIIALAACVLGTLMGIQGAWADQRLNRLLFGVDMRLHPPPLPIAACWAITIALTLLAAAPAVLRLARRQPRELLGAVRG